MLGTWKFQTTLPEGIANTCQINLNKILRVRIYGEEGHFSQIIIMWRSTEMKEKGNEIMKLSSPVRTQPWAKTYTESLPSKTPRCLHGFSKWLLLLVKSPGERCAVPEVVLPQLTPHATLNHPHFTDTYIYSIVIFWLPAKGQGGQNIWDYIGIQHNWVDQTSSVQITQSVMECEGR